MLEQDVSGCRICILHLICIYHSMRLPLHYCSHLLFVLNDSGRHWRASLRVSCLRSLSRFPRNDWNVSVWWRRWNVTVNRTASKTSCHTMTTVSALLRPGRTPMAISMLHMSRFDAEEICFVTLMLNFFSQTFCWSRLHAVCQCLWSVTAERHDMIISRHGFSCLELTSNTAVLSFHHS